jgi:altronate hydrolase
LKNVGLENAEWPDDGQILNRKMTVINIKQLFQITPKDNVAVALAPLAPGAALPTAAGELTLQEAVPQGHKVALRAIACGQPVVKYGFPIGNATQNIAPGQWVHTHNLTSGLHDKLDYVYQPGPRQLVTNTVANLGSLPSFQGYRRTDGQVGIRNEIWIINTVGCTNKQSERLADLARDQYAAAIAAGKIDGIFAYSHPYGCSQLGDDLTNTQKLLAGLVKHPNAAGVLVIGLGCENNQMADFKTFLTGYDPKRVKFLVLQEVDDEFQAGMELLEDLVAYGQTFKSELIPVSELKIGLKCGGSDGFSGITANPLVGGVSDQIISYGGTSILSEVPEMFGAETLLMNRAENEAVFNKIMALINNFKEYFLRNGQEVYENPSPGNKEGGITTLEDKSLGCTQKGGTTAVVDVLQYGERVKTHGLNLLQGPGNDIVSSSALTAAGAHLILFTTGRGNPMGAPVPTLKIATNSQLAAKKPHWIDFNAGQLLEGIGMEELTEQLFAHILAIAGKRELAKNEIYGYRDIAIFKSGVTL